MQGKVTVLVSVSGLGSFPEQTVRTQSLAMSIREGSSSKLLVTIHGAIHRGTRGRAAQGSGSRFGGATVSRPALGISGVERAQRNLGSQFFIHLLS